MRGDGLAFHAVMAIHQTVAAAVDVGIVDLRGIANEHDFLTFGYTRDHGLHFVRRELLRFVQDEKTARN